MTGSWCKGYASFRNVRALHQSPHWCCSWPCEILTFCFVVLFVSDLFWSGVILVCTISWGLQATFDTYYVEQRELITSFWDLQDPNVNNIVAATTFYSGTAATLCLVRSIRQQIYSPLVGLFSELGLQLKRAFDVDYSFKWLMGWKWPSCPTLRSCKIFRGLLQWLCIWQDNIAWYILQCITKRVMLYRYVLKQTHQTGRRCV